MRGKRTYKEVNAIAKVILHLDETFSLIDIHINWKINGKINSWVKSILFQMLVFPTFKHSKLVY